MTNMLEIKDLSFKYDVNYVFYNMNLNIKKNEFVYLIGTNNSGKTTLINILKNYPYDGQIYINGLEMCNKNSEKINKTMNIIDIDYVKKCKLTNIEEEIKCEKSSDVLKDYELLQIKNNFFNKLSFLDKIKVIIFLNLINDFQFLIIDEIIDLLEYKDKIYIYKLIKKYQKKFKKSILVISNNSDGIIYAKRIMILNKGKIIFNDILNNIEKNDNIFNDLSIKMPFIVDLSIKLKLYNLIDKIYVDEKRMIKDIWGK